MRTFFTVAIVVLCGCAPDASLPTPFVSMAGAAHPLALPEHDRGPLESSRRLSNLSWVFKLTAEQLRDRDALLEAQQDPGSPSYRQWLTPAQYAQRFGAHPEDVAQARAWLEAQGFEVHGLSPLGTRLTFSGTVAQAQAAFRTELHRYDVGAERHFAARSPPQVPGGFERVVLAIRGLHDFVPRPQYNAGGMTGFAPPDWANVYGAAPLYATGIGGVMINGTGVTIAVVGLADVAQSDVDAYRLKFGLPQSTVTKTLVPNTGLAAAGANGTGVEAIGDIEWAGGVATHATVNYVYTGADDPNIDDARDYAIEQNLAPVLSTSFAQCEAHTSVNDQDVLGVYASAANLLGITLVAASGDSGATGCLIDGKPGLYAMLPAASPNVTGVGGTSFPLGALTGSPYFTAWSNQETVWNDAHAANNVEAGGGGISTVFSRPAFQGSVATCPMVGQLPVAVDPTTMRQVPDVALNAGVFHNSTFFECSVSGSSQDCATTGGAPTLHLAGGTSFAAPAFAGVVALLNQVAAGRLGNINPLLYTLHAGVPTAFHDITTGNNEVSCTAVDPGCAASNLYGYPATSGYDCVSGLGSIETFNLASALASMAATTTTLVAMPTSATDGSSVTLTATVTAPAPNTSAVGGTVSFAFQSYDASGQVDLSWTLGTGTISGGTVSSGTGTQMGAIPPGLVNPGGQFVDVVAMYGGDAHHLPSISAKTRVTFAPLTLAISPATATIAPGDPLQFNQTGGVAPMRWLIKSDTTCGDAGTCSTLNAQTGAFTAGARPGTVVIRALDNDSAEAFATVTVQTFIDAGTPDAGTPDAGSPGDAGSPNDAGSANDAGSPNDAGSANDAGAIADAGTTNDAGSSADAGMTGNPPDAGGEPDAGSGGGGKSGCGCDESASSLGLWAMIAAVGLSRTRRRRLVQAR